MRKLASIQRITGLRPIPGADLIEAADVLGWSVVVKKGDFAVGDLVVYFEVDSWLDASNPVYASFEERFTNWGTKRGMRLKTIKLRKQLSQGLILSISDFVELSPSVRGSAVAEGDDVTDLLKVEKWEPLEAQQSEKDGPSQASKTRPFPWFLRKTDQERVQNYIGLIPNVADDEEFEATVKLDGSSMTVYVIGNENPYYAEVYKAWVARQRAGKSVAAKLWLRVKEFFGKADKPKFIAGVCSRNIELGLDADNHFSQYVRDHGIIDKITANSSTNEAIAFQGELIAPSIQENHEKVSGYEWHVFDVFNITEQTYLRPVAARLATEFSGLSYVPVLERRLSLKQFQSVLDPTPRAQVENILAYAEGPGMNPGVKREGVVFKSNRRDFSFKAISNSYLLKKG